MVQKVVSSNLISHPIYHVQVDDLNRSVPRGKQFKSDIPPHACASVVQRLVYKFSKLGIRVRFSALAPQKPVRAFFIASKSPLRGLIVLLEEGEIGDCADGCTEDYCEDNRDNERYSALVLFSAAFNHHGWNFFFVLHGCDAASVDILVWHFILLCEVASDR